MTGGATASRKKKGARRLRGKGHNHPNARPVGRRGVLPINIVLAGTGAVVDAAPSTSCYIPGPPQAVSRSSGLSVSCELLQAGAIPLTEADKAAPPDDAVASPPSPLLSMMKPISIRAPNSALWTRTSNAFLPVVQVSGLRSQKLATSFTAASAVP